MCSLDNCCHFWAPESGIRNHMTTCECAHPLEDKQLILVCLRNKQWKGSLLLPGIINWGDMIEILLDELISLIFSAWGDGLLVIASIVTSISGLCEIMKKKVKKIFLLLTIIYKKRLVLFKVKAAYKIFPNNF